MGTIVTDEFEVARGSGTKADVTTYPAGTNKAEGPGETQAGKRTAPPDLSEREPSLRTRGRSSTDSGTMVTVSEDAQAPTVEKTDATTCPAGTYNYDRTKCLRLTCFNADCNGDHASQRDRSPPKLLTSAVTGVRRGGSVILIKPWVDLRVLW